jgi:hypothetical protein
MANNKIKNMNIPEQWLKRKKGLFISTDKKYMLIKLEDYQPGLKLKESTKINPPANKNKIIETKKSKR